MNATTATPTETKNQLIAAADSPEILISARQGVAIDLAELWHRRELLGALVRRDLSVRYKQTALGVLWAAIQPLLTMVVFTVIFGQLAGLKSDGAPYPVFVLAGLVPWTFFAASVAQGSQSLLNQQHLLTRIYFPRLFVPLSAVGACVVDMAIALLIFAGVAAWYTVQPRWSMLLLPVPLALTVILAAGVSTLLSAVTVVYRDFRFIVGFALQLLFFLSPVVYPVTMIPERYRWIASLNPMTGIISAHRYAVLGTPLDVLSFTLAAAVSLIMLLVGFYYFRRTEQRFADIA